MGEVRALRPGFPLLTEGESVTLCADEPQGSFGVDRLSVSFPVDSVSVERFHQRTVNGHGEGARPLLGDRIVMAWRKDGRPDQPPKVAASIFVGATKIEGKWWGKLETNPSRILDPDGYSLADVSTCGMVAEVMADVASDFFRPAEDSSEWSVKRVDVARDFTGVVSPGFYVRGLLNVRRPYAKKTYLYADPSKGNAETLYAGSGAGGVRLYDQHAAYADKGAPEGSLRWEVEARGDWLSRSCGEEGAVRLALLTAENLRRLGRERWEWSGMGTKVEATVNVVEAIERMICVGHKGPDCPKDEHVTRAKADRLLGQLVRESFGIASTDRMTEVRYRALREAVGAIPAAELFAASSVTVAGRLDYVSGLEVAA